MNKVLVRRSTPWLVAVTALAIVPLEGATAAHHATAAAASSDTTVSSLTAIHSVASLSGLAATSAGAFNPASVSKPDWKQVPDGAGRARPNAGGAKSTAAPLPVPVVAPTAVSGTSGAVQSFDGINQYQNRYVASGGNQFTVTPPDQALCVGNGFVLESVNDSLRIFNTAGKALTPPIGLNAFYGYKPEINRTTFEFGPFPTDPTCYYDPQYGRWFHVVLTLDTNRKTGALTLKNHLDIAVSTTSNPLGSWVVYSIAAQDDGSQGTPKHASCPCLGDFPHIGADQNGFFITTNEYPFGTGPGVFGNNFNGAQVYALSKAQLAQAAKAVTLVHLSRLALNNGTPSFTLWPSEVPGTAYDTRDRGTEWFSQSTAAVQETNNAAGMSNNIAVWKLTNTQSLDSSSPDLMLRSRTLGSEVYGVPPPSEQKVGPVPLRDCLITACFPGLGPSRSEVEGPLDSSDTRMLTTWLAAGHLFAALDTVASVNGRYQAGIAYFVVDVSTDPIGISSQGYVAVDGNVIYPSIATDSKGNGAMAMSLAGAKYYPSAAYMTVALSGPTGVVTTAARGAGPDDEFCQYLFFSCGGTSITRPRWGDYGAAAIVGSQVWIASEFIDQRCTIQQYAVDPTCGGTRAPLSNWATRITQVTP